MKQKLQESKEWKAGRRERETSPDPWLDLVNTYSSKPPPAVKVSDCIYHTESHGAPVQHETCGWSPPVGVKPVDEMPQVKRRAPQCFPPPSPQNSSARNTSMWSCTLAVARDVRESSLSLASALRPSGPQAAAVD